MTLDPTTLAALSPLANHLWQSSLCLAAVWLLTLLLRRNRAAVRYGLWLSASLKFLLPFSLLVLLGSRFAWTQRSVTLPSPTQPQWSYVVENFSRPFAPSVAAAQASTPHDSISLLQLLLAIWLCGFAVSLVLCFRCWRQMRASRQQATPLSLGLPIPVLSSPTLLELGVFGIRRPVLLLPEGITGRLSPTLLQAVLAHEMCHVRRRDNLTAALHMLVEAVFWFYPPVRWIRARLLEEREGACDEAVVQMGADAEFYAEGILNVCKLYVESPLACVSGISGADLKKRVMRIISGHVVTSLDSGKKLLLTVTVIAAVFGPIILGMLDGPSIQAQSAPLNSGKQSRPSFEVASIRPKKGCEDDLRPRSLSPSPGRWEMPCVNVLNLIQAAYGTFADGVSINPQPLHMEGAPSWIRSEYYSVSAKAAGPESLEMVAGPMLQALLEERFRFQAHREQREMPIYAITVGKKGLKLQPLAEGACAPIVPGNPPPPPKPGEGPPNICGSMMMRPAENGDMMMDVRGSTMGQFAQRLSGRLDRSVIDRTGITGRFNFHLEFMPDPDMSGHQPSRGPGGDPGNTNASTNLTAAGAGADLFTAIQEQVGLKLESQKGPVEVLVIDHIERPSEN